MKKFIKFSLLAFVLVLPVVTFALDLRIGDQVSLPKGEGISGDVYLLGANATSGGVVSGDLSLLGGSGIISGDVRGDILSLGGNLTVLSDISDDARIAGGTVVLEGKVGGDLVALGGQVNVGGAGVSGDAVIAGGMVRLEAPVAGNLTVGGGDIYINSKIIGNVKVDADNLKLGSQAVIEGNLVYKGKYELVKEDGATVLGSVTYEEKAGRGKGAGMAVKASILSAFLVWKFFAMLACALLLGLVFRTYANKMVELAVKRPFYEAGRGLLTMAATPVISILLFFTAVGIPLGVLGLISFVAFMIFAWIFAPVLLGAVSYGYFFKKEMIVSWQSIVFGVFLFALLGLVPFVGSLARTILMLITIGVIVALKIQIIKEWR